jgi:hypothetical protein
MSSEPYYDYHSRYEPEDAFHDTYFGPSLSVPNLLIMAHLISVHSAIASISILAGLHGQPVRSKATRIIIGRGSEKQEYIRKMLQRTIGQQSRHSPRLRLHRSTNHPSTHFYASPKLGNTTGLKIACG